MRGWPPGERMVEHHSCGVNLSRDWAVQGRWISMTTEKLLQKDAPGEMCFLLTKKVQLHYSETFPAGLNSMSADSDQLVPVAYCTLQVAWQERLVMYPVSYLTLPGPLAGTFIPCESSWTYFIAGWCWPCVSRFHFLSIVNWDGHLTSRVKAQLLVSLWCSLEVSVSPFWCPPAV